LLKRGGGKLAEYATGMMGTGSGEKLLEKGIVKPSLTAGRLAANAEGVKKAAGEEIASVLGKSKPKALTNQVIGKINERIAEFQKSGLQPGAVKRLEKIKKGILSTGKKTMSAAESERNKRILGGKVNYERSVRLPEATEANKAAAQIFKDTTEGLVHRASPAMGQQFKAAKETFGLASNAAKNTAGKWDGSWTDGVKTLMNPKKALLGSTPVTTTAASGMYGAGNVLGRAGVQRAGQETARVATMTAIKNKFQPQQPDDTIEIPDPGLDQKRFDGVLSRGERAAISNSPKAQEIQAIPDEDMAQELFLMQQTDPEFQELMKEGQD
jgi:hypothetical protein